MEELQEALMRKAADMAEQIAGLKQSFNEERAAMLASHRDEKARLTEEKEAALVAAAQDAAAAASEAEER